MSIVEAPHRVPFLGHVIPLARGRLAYLQSLRPLGDVVRIYAGPRAFHILNSPDAINQVLVVEGDKFDKGSFFDNLAPFLGNGVLTCPKAEHRGQRRTLQPAFQRAAIDRYFDLMTQAATDQTSQYHSGQVIDAGHELHRLTIFVMSRVMFADGAAGVPEEIAHSLPHLIRGVMRRTMMPADFLNRIPTPASRRYNRAAADIRAVVRQTIAHYRGTGEDHGDLLSMLIQARDPDGGLLTDEHICDQAVTIMLAGSDSTAATLSWFLYAMAASPQIQDQLAAEVSTVLKGRPPGIEDVTRLPHIEHALLEALRLYHPIWFLTRRSTAPVTIAGQAFPTGTEFVYSLATLHRDPGIFPEPMAFRPDRWANASSPRHAYVPFGAGARKCIGDALAMTEMTVILAAFLQRWRVEPAEARPVRPIAQAIIHPDRLRLRLTSRA